jgi:hypothetical protein
MNTIIGNGITIGAGVWIKPGSLTPYTAGLVLHLDAGNPASYPGSGSAWTDLIFANTFTLYNGPAYSSSNGGCIIFDPASGHYAQSPSLGSSLPNWTVETWLYHDSTNMTINSSACIVTEVYTGNPINFTLGNVSDSFPNLQTGFFDGHWGVTSQGITLSTGQWYHLVGTWNGSLVKLYINGVLTDSYADGGTASSGGQGIRLMRRWDVPQYWGGKLAIVRIYDSDIGLSGVNQNWLANKSRFGL